MSTLGPPDEAVLDEVIALLDRFLRSTDALTSAINDRNATGMCDALERLGQAREHALMLVGREPARI